MKAVLFTLLFSLLCTPFAMAQELNAGIVQGLWYSHETVFANTPVRIYVAIRNNTGSDLTGTVEFYDNDTRLTRKTIQALDGRIIESWADWTPAYGEHKLRVTLVNIELSKIGEETKHIKASSALAEDTLFVDFDTDKDGIGNQDDPDDDNDGVSDEQEEKNGTDPLVKNKPDVPEAEKEDSASEDGEENTTPEVIATSEPTGPQGIERYLAASFAQEKLSQATDYITQTKQKLDSYRESRAAQEPEPIQQSAADAGATTTTSTLNGFGDIERSETPAKTETDSVWTHEFSIWDFTNSVWGLITTLFNTIYTFVLTALSWLLGHPILVQLGILILILLVLIKLAHKLGSRPKQKKI